MRIKPVRHGLRQRIIALAAAYVVALSSLVANFSAAGAEFTADAGGVLCQHVAAGEPAPATGQSNSKICAERCCTGCLMPLAALPQPVAARAALRTASVPLEPVMLAALSGPQTAKSHRARAPPA